MANPVIQASNAYTAQTAGFGATLQYLTVAPVVARVSIYLAPSAGTGQVRVKLNFTDDHSVRGITFDAAVLGSPVSICFPIRAANATNITVETAITGTITYDMYVVTETF